MTLFLAGPTGSGKSAVAVELAEMLDAEIVSSDAYQVYRELPILTAAPSPADRERVPHHMVSIIPVQKNWNATEHYHRAMRCMEEIHARGKIAIVTGGSGLYFKFLSHGLSEAPPGDAALRAAFANCSTEALYARLSSLDPEGAASTDAANRRYVERNLEIVLAGGKPLSFWKRNWLTPPRGPGWVISRDVPELDERIAHRAARMMQEGAVEETASLGPCSATAERTLGLALFPTSFFRAVMPLTSWVSGSLSVRWAPALWPVRPTRWTVSSPPRSWALRRPAPTALTACLTVTSASSWQTPSPSV